MTREEAIEKVRQMSLPKETMEILETLAPELKESEDERIRKDIIVAVEMYGDFTQSRKEEIYAYLEKQKKQNLIMANSPQLKEQKPAGEQFPPLEGLDAIKAKYYDEGFKNGFDEGVESVKPAEWSEEDEKMRDMIVAIFEVNHPNGFFKANEIDTTDMRGVHTEEIISWLKSLKPQPHWKPSKEEIDAFENLLKGEFPNKIFPGTTLANLLNTLKKLYYNEAIPSIWKPSEEQN